MSRCDKETVDKETLNEMTVNEETVDEKKVDEETVDKSMKGQSMRRWSMNWADLFLCESHGRTRERPVGKEGRQARPLSRKNIASFFAETIQ
jgi:hypothetical protein